MPSERLEPVPKPRAVVHLFESQPPLTENGVLVERYTTARHVIFEKHTLPSGVAHWFRVVKT
jgi:hypothetical protein